LFSARFIGFLIEHFGGDFPLWLAPQQVVILPVSDKYLDYALEVKSCFKEKGIRVKIDRRSEKIGAKIRDAELMKIPVMLIVGEKEVELKTVSVRRRHQGDLGSQVYDAFSDDLKIEISARSMDNDELKIIKDETSSAPLCEVVVFSKEETLVSFEIFILWSVILAFFIFSFCKTPQKKSSQKAPNPSNSS
jgi:hypothetical protein